PSLKILRGKRVFIVGQSGIGKSTILETLGMMNNTVVPDSSSRFVFRDSKNNAVDLIALWHQGDCKLSQFRLRNYSFIFQSTNLMRNFTAYENVAYTRMLQGYPKEECFNKTRQLLEDLGLDHIDENRLTQELSGGQQQRLAFARAVIPDYTVLFGDEPTGNLDPENAMKVMRMLSRRCDENGDASSIIVSHDMHLATTFADVIIKIRKGFRPGKNSEAETSVYGIIDDKCVYYPVDDRSCWEGNGISMPQSDFEDYLRKK
ncbi:MAG: ATP-binding cassette domain-containing protein, partial [Paramuribaculum sp.]|nr:ATP-binding cassette domain-containing protein [Paramuribaculum sp.]